MNKRLALIGCMLLACASLLWACSPRVPGAPPVTLDVETTPDLCIDAQTGAEMSYADAVSVAQQSECVQEGTLTESRVCNETTGTWWIDLNIEKPGCNPACVVDIGARSAEINWRCTGLVTAAATEIGQGGEPEITEAPESAPTPAATETPEPGPPAPTLEPLADWAKYTNETYGFTFRYPISWTIELLGDRPETEGRAQAVRLTRDTLSLLVEYRQPDEDLVIGPNELPEGEIAESGTATMLDRALPVYVLRQEDKDLVAFVGEQYVDLELYVEMRGIGEEGAAAEIPAAAMAEFMTILGAFSRTGAAAADPYPDWNTYESARSAATPGFTFRYPPDWSIDNSDSADSAALNLRSGALVLHIQAKHAADDTTALGPAEDPAGVISEAGTASFLGTATPRHVIVDAGLLKTVFIHHQDNAVEVYIALTGDPEQASNAEFEIPESARAVMDQILASFTLNTD